MTIHTDRKNPPGELSYALGTTEGRHNFLEDCWNLAEHMSTCNIVDELIIAMLITSNYEDSLCGVARALPKVIKRIQGLREDVFVLFLGIIMNLCCASDHEVVRQIAASLREIVLYVSGDIAEHLLVPLVMSLRVSFWSSPRAVAAAVLGVVASRGDLVMGSGVTVHEWFGWFRELIRDECYFVREMAVTSLHQWVAVAETHRVGFADIPLSLFQECVTNEKDDVMRFLCVSELFRLAEAMGKEAIAKYLQGLFVTLSNDPSWSVRHITAKHLGEFAGLCLCPNDLVDVFLSLCADSREETRAAAIEQLDVLSSYIVSEELIGKISTTVATLAKDKEPLVRMRVANLLHLLLSPSVVEVYTMEQRQALFGLLTDEDYVVGRCATRNLEKIAVSLNRHMRFAENVADDAVTTISHNTTPTSSEGGQTTRMMGSEKVTDCASFAPSNWSSSPSQSQSLQQSMCCGGAELRRRATFLLDRLIDYLHTVSDSNHWRIRQAVVISLRHFSAALPEKKFDSLLYILRSLLRDPVSAVQVSAAETFSEVARTYGPDWAALLAFDLLQNEFAAIHNTTYMWRILAIRCLPGILFVVCSLSPMDLRRQELLHQWMHLVKCFSEDSVSNVRLALANSIVEHWEFYAACDNRQDVIRLCVKRLQEDDDVDVSRVAKGLDMYDLNLGGRPF